MNRKTLVLPVAVGLLAPVLAACGGSDSGGDGDEAIVIGTTDAFAATSDAPAPFDPAYAYDAGSWNILRQTVQTLLMQPRGGGDPQPEAAERCGFTDNLNKRYECTLRGGLKFANGDALDAKAVKFSIERTLHLGNTLPEAQNSGVSSLLSGIDTVEAVGENKVVFHLNASDATFPQKLATPAAGIVNPDSYEKGKLRKGFEVDSSGPYTLETETRQGDGAEEVVKTVFTKNPNYKGSLELKSDKLEMRTFAKSAEMSAALKKGDIDVMGRTIEPAQIKEFTSGAVDGVELVEMPGLEIRYLGFDTDAPVVQEKAVRQAIAQVVDRASLVSEVYGTTAEELYSLVPSSITGHKNSFFNKYTDPSKDKAAQYLNKAGVKTPVKLTLNYTTDHYGEVTKQEFEVLRDQLNESKLFDVDIAGKPWKSFRPAELKGEYAVYGMGWFPDFPDADNFLAPFLTKDNILNSPYSNSRVVNDLIPQSRQEADRLAAGDSLKEIQDVVAEDVPVLPLWQGKTYVAARDDITGVEWVLNSSSNMQLWELGRGIGE
ncbi:ABC transporter substrate-binding protein [Streptomyces indicus]|uniref:Peptide/nickel transport system substrate-binding protein n=1 Tax=Streptomyces indicus TaxID=417292 RepID=A0A1G8XRB8_9ACTN|nr:ABC transporter substrate-binding protein [Streptomyces indicus]SDJ92445.1 peptide/nickel transport system substrate-binding protein [Streptomyces indicus]